MHMIFVACVLLFSQQEFAVWLRKLKQELCINLERCEWEGDGKEVQKRGDVGVPMADSY